MGGVGGRLEEEVGLPQAKIVSEAWTLRALSQ